MKKKSKPKIKARTWSMVLSAVIAIGLWFYVVTVITPEDSTWVYNIPITYENQDGLFSDLNLTISDASASTVNLKFYGKRSDLQKLNRNNITVSVDLNEITEAGSWDLTYTYQLPDSVSASAISLQARSISAVTLTVEKLATKTIEVRAAFDGDVASGYMADAVQPEYDSIEISGPEDLVDQVDYAQVVLQRTNVTKTITDSLPFTLYDAEGREVSSDEINCETDKIDVVMTVNMVKEIPLTVTLSAGGGATADHAVLDISPQTVQVVGDAEQLENLSSINLGTVDLGSIETDFTKTFTVVTPDGTQNLSDTEATVSVTLVNLKEKTLRVTNIEITNAPEDTSVVLGSSSLQVKLRGDEETIDSITASDVRAIVDLTLMSTTTGQFNVPVTIVVDGYSDVGAMGTYNILVTISESVGGNEAAVEVAQEPETASSAETEASPSASAADSASTSASAAASEDDAQ